MKGDTRCVDGRLMRHDPQADDPDLETDRGVCPECDGQGCDIDAATGTADDQSPVSEAVGRLIEQNGIHGTNGYRGPTQAEMKATERLIVLLGGGSSGRENHYRQEFARCGQICLIQDIDPLAIVRVVIRSLLPPTAEMLAVKWAGLTPDVASFTAAINAASPEVKP